MILRCTSDRTVTTEHFCIYKQSKRHLTDRRLQPKFFPFPQADRLNGGRGDNINVSISGTNCRDADDADTVFAYLLAQFVVLARQVSTHLFSHSMFVFCSRLSSSMGTASEPGSSIPLIVTGKLRIVEANFSPICSRSMTKWK